MERLEGALKSSFLTYNHHPQSFSDDFWPLNPPSGDDFFVDGLLDFSKDSVFLEDNDNNNTQLHIEKPSLICPLKSQKNDDHFPAFSIPETDLCLPADDVADLEWVSHFVDDSFSGGYSLTCPAGKVPEKKPDSEPENLTKTKPSFTTPVHTKARSKRTRTGGRVWSLGSSPLTDSSTSSSSSSSCTSNPLLIFHESSQTADSIFGKPPVKRQKKKKSALAETAGRRCSHCLVQKTPQWRAGPLGAKTLCNACGVRYKSGRLLPEYRPACSPTFSSEVHSNNHRKVLEMRQKKVAANGDRDGGLNYPVRSF